MTNPNIPIFREATLLDADAVAADIRPADAIELALATCGDAARQACRASVAISTAAWSATLGGRPLGVFGVCAGDPPDQPAIIWGIATTLADQVPLLFCRWSLVALRMAMAAVPKDTRFANAVHAEHTTSIRWLRWLGAEFGKPFPVEQQDGTAAVFLPFTIERSPACVTSK